MGIKNLNPFLKKKCIEAYTEVSLNKYSFQKVAIDITLFLFKYKAVFGDGWLDGFINLVSVLRKYDIHCVFVYDNKPPKEKDAEKKKRAEQKEKLVQKIYNISESITNFHYNKEINPLLQEVYDKVDDSPPRLLVKSKNFDISVVENYLGKIKKQVININKDDLVLTKQLFDILNVPYITATTEAEKTCSNLFLSGEVDAVLSDDTDVLAYGTHIFLTKINTGKGTCVEINLPKVLEILELTQTQFLDLCIMFGTDYNPNIPKIGVQTSFKLLQTHKCIESIAENTELDVNILDYHTVRKLFSLEDESSNKIPYCGSPDFIKLQHFMFHNNCQNTIDNIKKFYTNNNLSFDKN